MGEEEGEMRGDGVRKKCDDREEGRGDARVVVRKTY